MDAQLSIAEIEALEDAVDIIKNICRKARLNLQPVSTGSRKNNVLSDEQVAKMMSKRRKKLFKTA